MVSSVCSVVWLSWIEKRRERETFFKSPNWWGDSHQRFVLRLFRWDRFGLRITAANLFHWFFIIELRSRGNLLNDFAVWLLKYWRNDASLFKSIRLAVWYICGVIHSVGLHHCHWCLLPIATFNCFWWIKQIFYGSFSCWEEQTTTDLGPFRLCSISSSLEAASVPIN